MENNKKVLKLGTGMIIIPIETTEEERIERILKTKIGEVTELTHYTGKGKSKIDTVFVD